MIKKRVAVWVVFVVWSCASAFPAIAADNEVTREILTILHEKGDISDETYQSMIEKTDQAEVKKNALNASWNNGLRFESQDRAFKLAIGGRILNDWGSITPDSDLERAFEGQALEGTGTEMRHARFYMSGSVYNQFTFKADYDFAGTDADFKDVWIGLKGVPWLGEVRVGHQKEPFSLEGMNSLPNTTFMERGLPAAFGPVRNTGVKVHNSAVRGRLGWGIGLYKDVSTSDGFDDQSDYNVTGRLTGVPFTNEDGSRLMHLAMAYSHKFCDEDESQRYRSKPETNLTGVYLADTGSIAGVTGVDLLGPEIAFVYGPFCFQSEYVYSYMNRTSVDNLNFSGYYALCSFFLTGEHRVYKNDDAGGEFGQVIPNRPFQMGSDGWGAWQVALRYSSLDLNDGDIRGGEEIDYTFGINWFMNPNLRMTFNYVLANIDDRDNSVSGKPVVIDDENASIYMMRFQVEF